HPELAGGTPAQTTAEVAVHWYEGHDFAQALPAAVAAGTAAEQALAFAEAQRQFERALDLWDQVPDGAAGLPLDRAGLLAQTAQAAHFAGAWSGPCPPLAAPKRLTPTSTRSTWSPPSRRRRHEPGSWAGRRWR